MMETDNNTQSQKPKTCRLAIVAIAFGFFGLFYFGTSAIVWLNSDPAWRLAISNCMIGILSSYDWGTFCVPLASVLGIINGVLSLNEIKKSDGLLTGRGIAIAAVIMSVTGLIWFCFVLVCVRFYRFFPGGNSVS